MTPAELQEKKAEAFALAQSFPSGEKEAQAHSFLDVCEELMGMIQAHGSNEHTAATVGHLVNLTVSGLHLIKASPEQQG